MKKVFVVGSSNTDMVIRCNAVPQPGETLLGNSFATYQGGKGANQAVAALRAGAKTVFVAKVGDDDLGKAAKVAYLKEGIDCTFVSEKEAVSTGIANITIEEESGENSILVVSGANAFLSKEDVDAASKIFCEGDVLLVQLETPVETVDYALTLAKEYNLITILNPAPALALTDELLSKVDYITPNETEALFISGRTAIGGDQVDEIAKALLTKVNKGVIITLGADGVYYLDHDQQLSFEAVKVDVLDTTGAGDTFNGYFAAGLSQGSDMVTTIQKAIKAAGIAVTKHGAQDSIPSI